MLASEVVVRMRGHMDNHVLDSILKILEEEENEEQGEDE